MLKCNFICETKVFVVESNENRGQTAQGKLSRSLHRGGLKLTFVPATEGDHRSARHDKHVTMATAGEDLVFVRRLATRRVTNSSPKTLLSALATAGCARGNTPIPIGVCQYAVPVQMAMARVTRLRSPVHCCRRHCPQCWTPMFA